MKERTLCYICGTDIVIGEMTLWKDGNYYCACCQIDLNRQIEFDKIINNRKKRVERTIGGIRDGKLGVEGK